MAVHTAVGVARHCPRAVALSDDRRLGRLATFPELFFACPRGQHPVLCLQVLSHAASSEEGSPILGPCPRGGAPPTSCAVGPRKRQLSLVAAGTSSPCAALCLCHCSVARVAISCTILSVGVITHRGTISSPWWCAAELLRWLSRGCQHCRNPTCRFAARHSVGLCRNYYRCRSCHRPFRLNRDCVGARSHSPGSAV